MATDAHGVFFSSSAILKHPFKAVISIYSSGYGLFHQGAGARRAHPRAV